MTTRSAAQKRAAARKKNPRGFCWKCYREAVTVDPTPGWPANSSVQDPGRPACVIHSDAAAAKRASQVRVTLEEPEAAYIRRLLLFARSQDRDPAATAETDAEDAATQSALERKFGL